MGRHLKRAAAALLAAAMVMSLAGCIDQSQGKKSSGESTEVSAEAAESVAESDDAAYV